MKNLYLLLAMTVFITGCSEKETIGTQVASDGTVTTIEIVTETEITDITTSVTDVTTETIEFTTEITKVTEPTYQLDTATPLDVNSYETVVNFIRKNAVNQDYYTVIDGENINEFYCIPDYEAKFLGKVTDYGVVTLDTGVTGRLVYVYILGECDPIQDQFWFVDETGDVLYSASNLTSEVYNYSRLYTPYSDYAYKQFISGRISAKLRTQPIRFQYGYVHKYAGFLDEITYENHGEEIFWDFDELMNSVETKKMYGKSGEIGNGDIERGETYSMKLFLTGYVLAVLESKGGENLDIQTALDYNELIKIGYEMGISYMETKTYDEELFEQIKAGEYKFKNAPLPGFERFDVRIALEDMSILENPNADSEQLQLIPKDAKYTCYYNDTTFTEDERIFVKVEYNGTMGFIDTSKYII
ncbi:MAG: hypothetical protein LBM93_01095 [Oscillospiraceae bacterium]|jgi:hypothetical protein|nr:hypothetical protein [Oscillospiraceae bacterium]